MEMILLTVILAILLTALMLPGQSTQNNTMSGMDEYADYLAWRRSRQAAQNNAMDNSGCLSTFVLAMLVAAVLLVLLVTL